MYPFEVKIIMIIINMYNFLNQNIYIFATSYLFTYGIKGFEQKTHGCPYIF